MIIEHLRGQFRSADFIKANISNAVSMDVRRRAQGYLVQGKTARAIGEAERPMIGSTSVRRSIARWIRANREHFPDYIGKGVA